MKVLKREEKASTHVSDVVLGNAGSGNIDANGQNDYRHAANKIINKIRKQRNLLLNFGET